MTTVRMPHRLTALALAFAVTYSLLWTLASFAYPARVAAPIVLACAPGR